MTAPARKRPLRRKLLFATVACVGTLLLLEAAVRVREKLVYGTFARAGTTMFVPPAQQTHTAPVTSGVAVTSSGTVAPPSSGSLADELLLQPGLDVKGAKLQVHVNALGFRGREVTVPKPAGVKRIACIGGSTTFDIYAEKDELAWPALMEADLRARHPHVEVVNAGAGGRQLKHSLAALTWSRTAAVEPDIVFVYHATNEITDACHQLPNTRKTGARTIGSPAGNALKVITDWSLFAYKLWLVASALSKPPEVEGPEDLDIPDEAVQDFEHRLRDLIGRSKALGAKVALGTFALRWKADQPADVKRKLAEGAFPNYPGLSLNGIDRAFARYNATIVRIAREEGCLLVPVADHLSGEPRYFGDVMHTTHEGSKKLAAVVGEALEKAGWLD